MLPLFLENTMPQIETNTRIKINTAIKEPPLFKVVYLNDNTTSMEFVVESLIEHFDYNIDTAALITHDIHDSGSAVVAVLPFEIAEQKGTEITTQARAQSYPLQIKLEPALEN